MASLGGGEEGHSHTFCRVREKGLGFVYGSGTGRIRSASHEGSGEGLPVDEREAATSSRGWWDPPRARPGRQSQDGGPGAAHLD